MDLSNLGLAITISLMLALIAVLAMMGSLLFANRTANSRALSIAAQAREERRHMALASRGLDLRPLLASLSSLDGAGDTRLDVRMPAHPMRAFAVEAELQELFSRVTGYALSAMLGGTALLHISGSVDGGHVVVHWRVSDPADGCPPLARFFDHTEAASDARACERIAGRHGGRFYAAPGPGGALGLTLRLPLLVEAASMPTREKGQLRPSEVVR